MNKFIALLFTPILVLSGCSKEDSSRVNAFQKEASDYCYAHSVEYWKENELLEKLHNARPEEKQKMFIQEFDSKITSKEMNDIVLDKPKNITSINFYPYLQENIPKLTGEPFECEAIQKFYMSP